MGGTGSRPAGNPAIVALINEAITTNPVVVFSKSWCPYCGMAKDVLRAEGVTPLLFELDQREDGDAIQSQLEVLTGQRTVPNVFVGGQSIGGGSETAGLAESGQLDELLRAAGAK